MVQFDDPEESVAEDIFVIRGRLISMHQGISLKDIQGLRVQLLEKMKDLEHGMSVYQKKQEHLNSVFDEKDSEFQATRVRVKELSEELDELKKRVQTLHEELNKLEDPLLEVQEDGRLFQRGHAEGEECLRLLSEAERQVKVALSQQPSIPSPSATESAGSTHRPARLKSLLADARRRGSQSKKNMKRKRIKERKGVKRERERRKSKMRRRMRRRMKRRMIKMKIQRTTRWVERFPQRLFQSRS